MVLCFRVTSIPISVRLTEYLSPLNHVKGATVPPKQMKAGGRVSSEERLGLLILFV